MVIKPCSLTKTETARKGGLDPTAEAIGVVCKPYHARAKDHKRAEIGGASSSSARLLLKKEYACISPDYLVRAKQ